MSEHTDDFTAAQQAADMAYAMTMELTDDGAQASDDYKCVMTAYFAKAAKQINTVDPDWAAFCKRVDDTDCTSQWADRGQDH